MAKIKNVYSRIGQAKAKTSHHLIQADVEKGLENIRQAQLKRQHETVNELFNLAGKGLEVYGEVKEAQETKGEIEKGIELARKQNPNEEFSFEKTSLKDVMRGEGSWKDLGKSKYMLGEDEFTGADFQALYKKSQQINLNKLLGIKEFSQTTGEFQRDYGFEEGETLYDKVIQAESGGDADAVSDKGAHGIAQVLPSTAMKPGYGMKSIFEVATSMGIDYEDTTEDSAATLLMNPELGKAFGQEYFSTMTNFFGGDVERALVAYNAGPEVAKAWDGSRESLHPDAGFMKTDETYNYLNKILGEDIKYKTDALGNRIPVPYEQDKRTWEQKQNWEPFKFDSLFEIWNTGGGMK